MQPLSTELKQHARNLRRNQTDAEQKLWYLLRDRRLQQYKFTRQKVVGPYIVDFVCREYGVIIELDGGQHASQQDYDKKRDDYLQKEGYSIVRFWNNQLSENPDSILTAILDRLSTLTPTLSRQRERGNVLKE